MNICIKVNKRGIFWGKEQILNKMSTAYTSFYMYIILLVYTTCIIYIHILFFIILYGLCMSLPIWHRAIVWQIRSKAVDLLRYSTQPIAVISWQLYRTYLKNPFCLSNFLPFAPMLLIFVLFVYLREAFNIFAPVWLLTLDLLSQQGLFIYYLN